MKARVIYLFLSILIISSCSKNYLKQKADFTHYSLKQDPESENAKITIAEYKIKVDAETKKVIASSYDILIKDAEESPLGNFVCDALKYNGEKEFKNLPIDIVLFNRGGLRVNLPKGDIKIINIFELMPFENELILVKISGEKLTEALQTLLEKRHPFLGLKIKAQNNTLVETTINGSFIDKTKIYTVVTSDYLANGGDNFLFLKAPVAIEKSSLKIRDALINYCNYLTENKKQIIPYTDGRLQISK
ncbi:MAG: 5'-nucleotidase C-terminal domain-containing protein [Bacteroidetes bacterium]|nr:5'-nucleotidase C-terminal domain-containing protein [Bacteroidota bacterium]